MIRKGGSGTVLSAPFPYFGGKSSVADYVWARLGDVDNYIEPFCGSAAMLLSRPTNPQTETVNDRNAYIANFWRSTRFDPEGVAKHADWPVNETDLHARHQWLVYSSYANDSLQKVKDDPDYYDIKIAGWWVWGACCWIAGGWCPETINENNKLSMSLPSLGGGRGLGRSMPSIQKMGIHNKSMYGSNSGQRLSDDEFDLVGEGSCDGRLEWITKWMSRLSDRLRHVRVCCGDWDRICDSPSTMNLQGLTGVFLDPPYRMSIGEGDEKKKNRTEVYGNDKVQDINQLCDKVEAWCLKWGVRDDVRVALCGYEGEYPQLEESGWIGYRWKAQGGYSNQNRKGNDNRHRETILFSPHCLKITESPKGFF